MIWLLLIILLGTLIVLFGYTWYRLRKQIYIRIRLGMLKPSDFNLPATLEYATNSDGQKISYWYIKGKKDKPVIILIHGYFPPEGGKSMMLHHAKYLYSKGYTTVLIDLRAHGDSEGNKIFLGLQEWKDVVCVYDSLKEKTEHKHSKVGYFGLSMGGFVSITVVGHSKKGDFVIASVPYSSLDNLFKFQITKAGFPLFPFFYLMKLAACIEFGFDYEKNSPIRMVDKIKVPMLVFRAMNDEELNSEDAKVIYQKAGSLRKFLWEADSGHDIHRYKQKEFEEKILEFLENI